MSRERYAVLGGAGLFFAFFLLLMLPRWCGIGMFIDGVTYATIARNLVEAVPLRPWDLHYTATLHAQFFEHPPLGIWMMAVPFALLGDVPRAETLYSVWMACAFVSAAAMLWRAAQPQGPGAWLYCMLLFCCPLTSWVLANNMLEAPLTLFCMLALACLLHASRAAGPVCALWGAAAGLCAVAALLSKGPMALFLAAWPAVAWVGWPLRRRAVIVSSVAAGLVVAGVATVLLSDTEAYAYVTTYYQRQVVQSLSGAREMAAWRGVALTRLLSELVLPCLAVWALHGVCVRSGMPAATLGDARGSKRRETRAWLLLALAASVPVVISPKQSGWYVFQSLPVYTLALATHFQAELLRLQDFVGNHVRHVRALALSTAAVACAVAGLRWGHVDKHKEFYRDLARVNEVPKYALVQVCPTGLLTNWGLHANMARTFHASLASVAASWHLVDTTACCSIPKGCRAVSGDVATARYVLYACDAG